MTRRPLLALCVLLVWAVAYPPRAATLTAAPWPSAATAAATEYGPSNGTLVIVGGGNLDGVGILETFIALGGGTEDGKFIIVPTAMGNRNSRGEVVTYNEASVVAGWLRLGVRNVKMLHTHDPKIADTEAFVEDLREATAVWFTGGRHWNIVDSYANTLTYREFHKVLERNGVIGGNSAGATIQGEYLVRGDTRGNHIVMTREPNHQRGFEFLRRSAIDQHIDARNRWDDLIPVIKWYPNLLGIGLSERTAIVVKGDQFEVIGAWKVAIHDNTRQYGWRKPYYLLSPGDIYNMKTRQVVTDADVRSRLSTAVPIGTAHHTRGSAGLGTRWSGK